MAYLHENREEFTNAVNLASEYFHILPIIAEKDYYVTMILRELSERQDFIVFKGGTSLSKCYKAIKRFSEDIDITIDSKLTQRQMKKLKESIKVIAEQLGITYRILMKHAVGEATTAIFWSINLCFQSRMMLFRMLC